MRRHASLVVAVLAAALLIGCQLPFSSSGEDGAVAAVTGSLPPDESRDVPRSVDGPFTFETLYSVDTVLKIDLYQTDESGRILDDTIDPALADIFVSLDDSEGNPVFSGMVADDGTLSTSVQLPSAAEDMTLTIRAAGFETRTIRIDDMAAFERIDRTISLVRIGSAESGPLARSAEPDADGDGVPDSEDQAPDNPNVAFYAYVPSREAITVAYEDLFGRAQAGDADYNDFIASYTIVEGLNASLHVTEIAVNATAVQKLAGYDHRFGIRLDTFAGTATVTGSYIDADGTQRIYTDRPATGPEEIDLFLNSRNATGRSAGFTIEFNQPQVRDGSDGQLPTAPYNPYLVVRTTGHDIHLIGREANTISINPGDPFVDREGFPWALLVPRAWVHPDEGQRIEVHYPRFTLWRESGGADHADWYDHFDDPYDPSEDAVVYVGGFVNDGTKDVAAYWVDDGESISRVELSPGLQGSVAGLDLDDAGVMHAVGTVRVGDEDTAAYWRDGVLTQLSSNARATGMVLGADGSTYVSGSRDNGTHDTAVLWVVSGDVVAIHELHTSSRSVATDVDYDAGAVYISGHHNNGTHDVASFWTKSGDSVTRVDLYGSGLSQANAIDRADGSTYVAGRYLNGSVFAAYWVNDAAGLVTLTGNAGNAGDIAATAAGPVVAGDYLGADAVRRAALWTGTGPADLPSALAGASAFAAGLAHLGESRYVAGWQNAGTEEAVYWLDGNVVELSPAIRSRAVAVSAEQ